MLRTASPIDTSSFNASAGQYYSSPILASSPIPQSPSLSRWGIWPGKTSSSSGELKLSLPLAEERLSVPDLNPEDFVLESSSAAASLLLSADWPVSPGDRLLSRLGRLLWVGVGVGEGVISVLAVISTSSASRYHFLRRVYLPQPSCPRRPFCHCIV